MANTILKTTKTNIKRNRLLSVSTIFVTTIVLLLSSIFITASIFADKGVKIYEKKAQVIVFFKKETTETDIMAFKDKIYDETLVSDISYVSQSQALSIYKEEYADDPALLATVTADSLPPSLEIRATSAEALLTVIERINKEKETNANIDEIMYFEDVVKSLQTLSNIVNISSIVIICILGIISFILIRITIGFNINAHKEEIKIMDLVGSPRNFIKTPFILEGMYYGVVGGFFAATFIIGPWYIAMHYLTGTDYSYWINQVLNDFDMSYLKSFDLTFLLIYYGVHVGIGGFVGMVSSISAVRKYLK